MNETKRNSGFTLVETLVALNLMFISLTFLFSFYLFVYKFSDILSKKFTDQYILQRYFSDLNHTLRKSDSYKIVVNDLWLNLITDDDDSLYISCDSIFCNKLGSISDGANFSLLVVSYDGEELKLKDGQIWITSIKNHEENTIFSSDIKALLFVINKNGKNYSYEIYNRNYSMKRFSNIE